MVIFRIPFVSHILCIGLLFLILREKYYNIVTYILLYTSHFAARDEIWFEYIKVLWKSLSLNIFKLICNYGPEGSISRKLYGSKALWLECSMARMLYGPNALWLEGSMARRLYLETQSLMNFFAFSKFLNVNPLRVWLNLF